jgi:hypothetical protein
MHDFSDPAQRTEHSSKRPSQPSARSPIGFKQGLEELHAVFEASDPTENPSTRLVVIVLPEKIPEFMRANHSSGTAVRAFFLIAGQSLVDDQARLGQEPASPKLSLPDSADRSLTKETSLPNGGLIGLTVRKIKQPLGPEQSIGGLILENHGVTGYEQVTLIEFMSQ